MILSPKIEAFIGKQLITNQANALVSLEESGDEADIEPVRPAHRQVHADADGITLAYSEDVVPAKVGAA